LEVRESQKNLQVDCLSISITFFEPSSISRELNGRTLTATFTDDIFFYLLELEKPETKNVYEL
jgi:hypothetical protein